MTEPKPASPVRQRLRKLAPWLVAAGMLAWLFKIVPLDKLETALGKAPLGAFLALTVAYLAGTLAADSFATWATFRSALRDVPLRFADTFELRAASYILAIVHYGAGQGGLGYFLYKRHGVALPRVAGAVMLVMGVNVVVVALSALLGIVVGGPPEAQAIRWIVIALACGFPAYLAVILARPAFLTRIKLIKPLFEAGVRGHLVAAAARVPHIGWLITCNYVAMQMFQVDIPIGKAIALFPIVFVVGVLPISPSGLGTAQAAAVALFAPFARGDTLQDQEAAVLACSLALQFVCLILQAAVGLVFLRRVMRKGNLERGDQPPSPDGQV
jgi:uncharacterized membrane protein YbhN (UPF0104 family)